VALARSFFDEMYNQLVALGIDTTQFERFRESGVGWPDEEIDLVRDVSDYIEMKWEAFYCHKTQINPNSPFRKISDEMMKKMISKEHFVLAQPERNSKPKLLDLFG